MTRIFDQFSGLGTGILGALILSACSNATHDVFPVTDPADTPEIRVGERLFREPRFSQLYFSESRGNVNLAVDGVPVLSLLPREGHRLKSPFEGQTMSCVACHMVDDAAAMAGGGVRAYADFTGRTLIPVRDDGSMVTTRNTPALVGASETRELPEVFHFDGEFATLEDLVIGGWTGRNFGWLVSEGATAKAQVAEVLRGDDGNNALARKFDGSSYAVLLKGEDPSIPAEYRVSEKYRIDVAAADDETIARKAAELVAIYMRALQFTKDREGFFSGSPYDEFLSKNGLPRAPETGESRAAYADRLAWEVAKLGKPEWVEGEFELHAHEYRFGPLEYRGLRIFLARQAEPTPVSPGFRSVGNCVACHAPPNFTDFKFHNTGEAQDEYDSIHGSGAFVNLAIPDARTGARDLNRFRVPPSLARPGTVDLGLWNVIFNPAMPAPQAKLQAIVCEGLASCDAGAVLPRAIGAFKTAGLRDLGQSEPYFHTGRKRSVEDVLRFYVQVSAQAHDGTLRNPDPEVARIAIGAEDVEALSAFLRALDEDYE
jgi:cytochrome c peroxidase